ncbi:hypothetical protein DSL92_03815 [Billgrantia gudaonensis]|uniref:Uncharacterized protein n=1 Tax=Billgrantia gudaonensis TaxID=376427 RepID=A0A3S0QG08_9GAMM|nr:hypothetical protein DSL92_03815 [Halomonas gudaonensis]
MLTDCTDAPGYRLAAAHCLLPASHPTPGRSASTNGSATACCFLVDWPGSHDGLGCRHDRDGVLSRPSHDRERQYSPTGGHILFAIVVIRSGVPAIMTPAAEKPGR